MKAWVLWGAAKESLRWRWQPWKENEPAFL
jgi:hypothetical protein